MISVPCNFHALKMSTGDCSPLIPGRQNPIVLGVVVAPWFNKCSSMKRAPSQRKCSAHSQRQKNPTRNMRRIHLAPAGLQHLAGAPEKLRRNGSPCPSLGSWPFASRHPSSVSDPLRNSSFGGAKLQNQTHKTRENRNAFQTPA